MEMTRRDFLKTSGATTGVALLGIFNTRDFIDYVDKVELRIKHARQTTTICPYCGCGCGFIVHSIGDTVVNIEGDPDHPINRGSTCPKGAALFQIANNERRLATVRYRAPHSSHWEEVTWDWAIDRISQRIKEARDAGLADGRTHNSIDTIAALGGAALDNEECYLYSKMMRILGARYLEHQARL